MSYGRGQGIVIAKSRRMARELVESTSSFETGSDGPVKLEAIKLRSGKQQLFDFSWSE